MNIDPDNEERSTARTSYYNPYAYRHNLWISTGQLVTQIFFEGRPPNSMASAPIPGDTSNGQGGFPGHPTGIFGGTTTLNITNVADPYATSWKSNPVRWLVKRMMGMVKWRRDATAATSGDPSSSTLVATGVEFAPDAQSPRQTALATREVIVAAGALHSPQLLMLSGIGPATTLQAQGVPVNVDLPGVGNNLQDHGQVWCWYPFYNESYPNPTMLAHNESFADAAWEDYWANRTGPLTSGAIDGVAFPALPYVVNGSTAIADAAKAQAPQQFLPTGVDSTVLEGFARQQSMMTSALTDVTRAAYEIINANDGVLTVANMRPLSRGTITINSPTPFAPPVIDPRYGSNPIDVQIIQAAMVFNQRLMYTESLSQMDPTQRYPAADAEDVEMLQYINVRYQTEYHPAGTCAMMPLELGGVVSPELLVYGTQNLRVVDSSIMPMLPAAHLQAVVYGVAEKAADIIKAANKDNSYGNPTKSQSESTSTADVGSTLPRTSTSSPATQLPSSGTANTNNSSIRTTVTQLGSTSTAGSTVHSTSTSPLATQPTSSSVALANNSASNTLKSQSDSGSTSTADVISSLPSPLTSPLAGPPPASITYAGPVIVTTFVTVVYTQTVYMT
ncbi:hypothetical protein LTR37_007483 [Vermiconidia calcicola]|uniref:Uncharacterized protein n=1 Tax=Vermiconidia calcicola TaxID=1690605 RepID=A0ACC3NDX7_9PEZI|nr:hypothetical protein LTR37_007483 [Vermiconidia calcicola]